MGKHWDSPLKGKKRPPEVIAKIKAIKNTEENKAKIRKALTGKKRPPEIRKKISDAKKGKPLSEESKIKIGLANRGRKLTKKQLANRIGEKAHRSKLKEKDIILIRRLYEQEECSHRSLANRFGVGKSTITAILSRKSWTHI